MAKKGKWFEDKSRTVLSDLFPAGTPIHSEKTIPTKWEGFRKVDIGIGRPGSFDYVILECKDEKSVGPSAVDQAVGIREDVGAKNAALLVNGRISKNALKKAESNSIKAFNIIDPNDDRIRPHIWVKVITHFIWLQKFRYSLILFGQEHKIYGDPNDVYIEPGKTLTQFVKDKWNEGILSREIGIHSYSLEKFHMITAPLLGIKTATVDEIRIEYEIVRASYFSKVELSKGVGLYNISEEVFIPSSDFIWSYNIGRCAKRKENRKSRRNRRSCFYRVCLSC